VPPDSRSAHPPRAAGVRVIVIYKLSKAILQACAAIALGLAIRAGAAPRVADLALALADHSVHPVVVRVARWLSVIVTPSHLHVLVLLLAGDALVSAAEGWVLRQGYPWGSWLVVIATGSLLPFELYEIVVHPKLGRVILFFVNAAIVITLAASRRRTPTTESLS
jgi:uncharacterized membrane protein (DUF2068 family)